MFWISYKDLLSKYQSFDRTRLFGSDWHITQQWTTVDVPWTTDYNETKFSLTLTKASPVVIVLSKVQMTLGAMNQSPKLTLCSLMIDISKGLRASTLFLCTSVSRKTASRITLFAATVIT